MDEDQVDERDIALATFRQTRAVKWLLAVALGLVLLVVAVNAALDYRDERQLRRTCAEAEAFLAEFEDSPALDDPTLGGKFDAFERMQRNLC